MGQQTTKFMIGQKVQITQGGYGFYAVGIIGTVVFINETGEYFGIAFDDIQLKVYAKELQHTHLHDMGGRFDKPRAWLVHPEHMRILTFDEYEGIAHADREPIELEQFDQSFKETVSSIDNYLNLLAIRHSNTQEGGEDDG